MLSFLSPMGGTLSTANALCTSLSQCVSCTPLTAKEQTSKWTRELQRSIRGIEREIKTSQASINQTKAQLKRETNSVAATILAREVVRANKTIEKKMKAIATLQKAKQDLRHQASLARTSRVVSNAASAAINMTRAVDPLAATRTVILEMQKANMASSELDTLLSLNEDDEEDIDDMDEESARLVNNVLAELCPEVVKTAPPPQREASPVHDDALDNVENPEHTIEHMQRRLANLSTT